MENILISHNKIEDDLCGWHLDHGCITTLVSPAYIDEIRKKKIKEPEYSGLYTINKENKIIKVNIPEDCIAIQIGEIFQILSNGLLKATPHCVSNGIINNISREQFVLFMDCEYNQKLNIPDYGNTLDYTLNNNINNNMSNEIIKLEERFKDCDYYYQFEENCLNAYYDKEEK